VNYSIRPGGFLSGVCAFFSGVTALNYDSQLWMVAWASIAAMWTLLAWLFGRKSLLIVLVCELLLASLSFALALFSREQAIQTSVIVALAPIAGLHAIVWMAISPSLRCWRAKSSESQGNEAE